MAAHGVAHPVARKSTRSSRDGGANARTQEFTASQHVELL
jgi:hypothetical protein